MILANFFVVRFLKIVFLLFFSVYGFTPYFLFVKGVVYDFLLPFEAYLFVGLSFVGFCWVGKLVLEMLKR